MDKLRNTRCFSSVPGVLSWGKGQQDPAWRLLCIIFWAQIHIHVCHILTSNVSLEISLILTVILQREEKKTQVQKGGVGPQSRSQPMATAQIGPCLPGSGSWVPSTPTPHLSIGREEAKSSRYGAPCPCL